MRKYVTIHFIPKHEQSAQGYVFMHGFRYGLVVRIPGSHPGGPGSIPGNGIFSYSQPPAIKKLDEDGIRTHAGRAHWISSPTP